MLFPRLRAVLASFSVLENASVRRVVRLPNVLNWSTRKSWFNPSSPITLEPLLTKTTSRVKVAREPASPRRTPSIHAVCTAGSAPGARSGSTDTASCGAAMTSASSAAAPARKTPISVRLRASRKSTRTSSRTRCPA
jgi:hypothetical protein